MEQFAWTPGEGADPAALGRLRAHFPRPAKPMGEAWFMGTERRMFRALMGNLDALSTADLQVPLEEIASGTAAFGPREEWKAWYHYLLGALLPRSHASHVSCLLELLVTGFMAIYPNGVWREPYKGFQEDVLLTLGRCMMDSACWTGADIAIGKVLHPAHDHAHRDGQWGNASGDLAASMLFCLKYLPADAVAPWLRSVLEVPSPHWRAQLLVWLVGAHGILNNVIQWPAEFSGDAWPAIEWDWSHCLTRAVAAADDSGAVPVPALLPEAARSAALQVVRSYFSENQFLAWLECIATVPYLAAALAYLPSTFEALYVRRADAG